MKVLKIHLMEMIVAILFVVLVCCFVRSNRGESEIAGDIPYEDNWSWVTAEEVREYQELPKEIDIPEGEEEIILRKRLDEQLEVGSSIGFYSSHQIIYAFIDGKQIFAREVPETAKSRSPGNCWNFIKLQKEYAGKVLEIHIKNCYKSGSVKIPEFVLGARSAIIMRQIRENAVSLLIGIIMLMIGLTLLISWFTIGKRMHFHEGIPWLGLFTIHFAIWSTMETQIPMLMFGREVLINQITFMSLKLMSLPIIYFVQVIYQMKDSRVLNLFAWLSLLDFAVSFLGQFMGWFDFRQTVWFTHLLGIFVAIAAVVLGCIMLVKKGNKLFRRKRKLWINIIGICIVGGCMIIDAMNYYYGFYKDVAAFSRIGCLIFILILALQFLEDSMKLIEAGKQVEAIREEAELDGLTMLKNRKTFELDLHEIHTTEYKKYGFVVFDLNNLKMMNDLYGHGMGDCYIIIGSEIIQDVFGGLGEIYRIGGDEFCLISDCITQQIYQEKEKQMCDWLGSLRGAQVKDFMQIASGFAMYSRGSDMNLHDTIGRADEQMYRRKREQKEKRA